MIQTEKMWVWDPFQSSLHSSNHRRKTYNWNRCHADARNCASASECDVALGWYPMISSWFRVIRTRYFHTWILEMVIENCIYNSTESINNSKLLCWGIWFIAQVICIPLAKKAWRPLQVIYTSSIKGSQQSSKLCVPS